MQHFIKTTLFVLAISIPATTCRAGVITEQFNSIVHGQIVDNEFNSGLYGFTVVGDNVNDNRDWVVGFDTFRASTNDPDLQDPFSKGNARYHNGRADLIDPNLPNGYNASVSRFQEILVLQESGVGADTNGDGFLDDPNNSQGPDDEGSRPAGSIAFEFNNAISSFGIDLLDVEGDLEKFTLEFMQDGNVLAEVSMEEFATNQNSIFYDSSIEFGNNSANRLEAITASKLSQFTNTSISSFDTVKLNLGGSGGVDNIKFLSTVPEPTSLFTWGFGMCLLGLRSRRRKSA